MPTKKSPAQRSPRREYDPEHEDLAYGGDMEHDDPDEDHEDAMKGGRPHSEDVQPSGRSDRRRR